MRFDTDLSPSLVYNPPISSRNIFSVHGTLVCFNARDEGEPKMKLRFLVVFVLLSAALLVGQTFRGTILGSVTDSSGAFVAGATVKVRNVATGLERTTITSADGSYAVPELPIGTYSVTVTQTGFDTFVATGVIVDVASERRVDAALKTGQVSTRIEVSAEDLPMVETTTNTLGGVISAETVENMPVNGRDYTKLIYLNPGVAGSPDQISDSPGSFGEFSMNGARGRSNNYLLDGTDMNDGTAMTRPSIRREYLARPRPSFRSTQWPKSTFFRTSSPNMDATPVRSLTLSPRAAAIPSTEPPANISATTRWMLEITSIR
jgi:hypothetical protein